MTVEIKAPSFPESIAEGTVATWYKQPGEAVQRDELIVDIETDKVVLEVVAPANGTISKVLKAEGEVVLSDEVIAEFTTGDVAMTVTEASAPEADSKTPSEDEGAANETETESAIDTSGECFASPAARKLIEENTLDASAITATGKGGRVTKEDVINHMKAQQAPAPVAAPVSSPVSPEPNMPPLPSVTSMMGDRPEKRVPMTRLICSPL